MDQQPADVTPPTSGQAWPAGPTRRSYLGDNFATVNTRYREVDSGFTQIDQTSNHFQHSTQYGVDYTSNAVSMFGAPLATQFSYTDQNLYTETALLQNPYFSALPDTRSENTTGSINYTKDLGAAWGRLTNVRLSESTYTENDVYKNPAYLNQPGIQGNTQKGKPNLYLGSTYDAPALVLGLSRWGQPIYGDLHSHLRPPNLHF